MSKYEIINGQCFSGNAAQADIDRCMNEAYRDHRLKIAGALWAKWLDDTDTELRNELETELYEHAWRPHPDWFCPGDREGTPSKMASLQARYDALFAAAKAFIDFSSEECSYRDAYDCLQPLWAIFRPGDVPKPFVPPPKPELRLWRDVAKEEFWGAVVGDKVVAMNGWTYPHSALVEIDSTGQPIPTDGGAK